MSVYKEEWDLTTIPNKQFTSERGRRNGVKSTQAFKTKKVCRFCGLPWKAGSHLHKCGLCGKDDRAK